MLADVESRLAIIDPFWGGLEIAAMVFLLVMASESAWDYFAGYRHSLKETLANFAIGLVYSLLDRTVYGLIIVGAVFLSEPFAFADIPVTWWSWPLAVLAADFTYYWMHRCEHRVGLFWAYHNVHHSSPEFNFSTALRLGWAEALFEWMFFVPMVLVGFDPVQVLTGLAIVVAYQSWIHTEKIGRLGRLEFVLNTPSSHRVHHASNPDYLDRNYGGILIVWDRLFGTYMPETVPVRYGITEALETSNPVWINLHGFSKLARDVFSSGSFRCGLKTFVMPPGWSGETKPADTDRLPKRS